MKFKKVLVLLSIIFLSAGCNLFQKAPTAGVIKTVNGGVDWQFSNVLKNVKNGSIGSLNIAKLELDPHNRETIYAGTYNDGLYKSEDSGSSWARILSKIFVYDFAISPTDPKTIYVAGLYADQGRVLKTTDGGATWQGIYNDAGTANAVRGIALNPAALNQIVIGLASGDIIASMDSGMTWKLAGSLKDRVNRIAWRNNGIYILLMNKGLVASNDLGITYRNLTDSLLSGIFRISFAENMTGAADAFNQFYVDTLSSSLIYVTTTRGLYKTTDGGQTWTPVPLPAKSGDGNVRAVAIAQSSSNLVFTSVGNTVYKTTDGGQTWQTQNIVTNGFINYILIDPQLPQISYGGIYVQ